MFVIRRRGSYQRGNGLRGDGRELWPDRQEPRKRASVTRRTEEAVKTNLRYNYIRYVTLTRKKISAYLGLFLKCRRSPSELRAQKERKNGKMALNIRFFRFFKLIDFSQLSELRQLALKDRLLGCSPSADPSLGSALLPNLLLPWYGRGLPS